MVKLRKSKPYWSKYKLKRELEKKNIMIGTSAIDRILKRRGLVDLYIARGRTKAAKNPKPRFPRGMKISRPGDLVGIDAKHVMLAGRAVLSVHGY